MNIAPVTSVFALVFAISAGLPAYADRPNMWDDYRQLQQIPADYQTFGTICEQIAKLRLQEEYPEPDFEVRVGITYSLAERTIGELDVVVFRSTDGEVVLVSEVKCRQSMLEAAEQARSQLERFQHHVALYPHLRIYELHRPDCRYHASQFDENPEYITMAQRPDSRTTSENHGRPQSGFDRDIGHSLRAVRHLRNLLLSCQDRGDCPQPTH